MNQNGHAPVQQIQLKWSGRMLPVTADGAVYYRAICLAAYPDGDREVCTVEFQVWEGGLEILRQCAPTAAQLAVAIATKQLSGLLLAKV